MIGNWKKFSSASDNRRRIQAGAGGESESSADRFAGGARGSDSAFKEDTARMLLDDARVLDGDRPSDALEFSKRLARIVERGLRRSTAEGSD